MLPTWPQDGLNTAQDQPTNQPTNQMTNQPTNCGQCVLTMCLTIVDHVLMISEYVFWAMFDYVLNDV
jgi:hypothetical protein